MQTVWADALVTGSCCKDHCYSSTQQHYCTASLSPFCSVPTSASATKTCSRVVCEMEYSSTPSSLRASSMLANSDGRSKSCNVYTQHVMVSGKWILCQSATFHLHCCTQGLSPKRVWSDNAAIVVRTSEFSTRNRFRTGSRTWTAVRPAGPANPCGMLARG